MSDDVHVRRLAWGLDLANPDVTAQEEIDEFRRCRRNSSASSRPAATRPPAPIRAK